jgi:hypothetical protein
MLRTQDNSSGHSNQAPTESPSHQVTQTEAYSFHVTEPVNASDVAPIVALTGVATSPVSRASLMRS